MPQIRFLSHYFVFKEVVAVLMCNPNYNDLNRQPPLFHRHQFFAVSISLCQETTM